jgi:hypothetical protein
LRKDVAAIRFRAKQVVTLKIVLIWFYSNQNNIAQS